MNVWENFTKKINEAASYTAHEADKIKGTAKLKYKLMNLRSKESELYEKIGKLCYAQMKDITETGGVSDNAPEILGLIDDIDIIKAEIVSVEAELMMIKNKVICRSCSAKIDRDMIFCPHCGARQDKANDEDGKEDIPFNVSSAEVGEDDCGCDSINEDLTEEENVSSDEE